MIHIRSFFLITVFVLFNVGILCGMQGPACSGDGVPFCSVESTCFVPRVDDVLRIPEQLEVYHERAVLNYGFDIFSLPQHDPSSADGEDEDCGLLGIQSYEERSTFFKIHFHIKPEFFFSFANDFIRFFYSNPLLQSYVSKFKITDNPLRDCHFQRDGAFVVPMVENDNL